MSAISVRSYRPRGVARHTLSWRRHTWRSAAPLGVALCITVLCASAPAGAQPDWEPQPEPQRAPAPSWSPGQEVPGGYHVEKTPRWGLVAFGAIQFLVPYSLALVTAGQDSSQAFGAVPVFGALVEAAAYRDRSPPGVLGDWSGLGRFLWGLNAAAQISGATLFTVGIACPVRELVRDETRSSHFQVTPLVFGRGGAGLQLKGTF